MSNNKFVKGECIQCAGHLEFPAHAAGEVIDCPHCGQRTKLVAAISVATVAPVSRRPVFLAGLLLAILALASGLVVFVFFYQPKPVIAPRPASAPPAANQLTTKSSPDEILTNEFSIAGVRLEQTAGSSLRYVTGEIRNLAARQRFGVKLQLGLLATNQVPVGKATDYDPVLEPHASWRFKALVMDSKTASARFASIGETP